MQKALPPYRSLISTAASAAAPARLVDTNNVAMDVTSTRAKTSELSNRDKERGIAKSRSNESPSNIGGQNSSDNQQSGEIVANKSVAKLVSENAVIAFGRRGCCMCHVVKQLLLGLGVNPTIFLVEEDEEASVIDELSRIGCGGGGGGDGDKLQFPAVFVGGKLFGGLERVMAAHITGELVPMLREARALWL